MSEKIKIWEPLQNIQGRYWLEYIVDKREYIKSGNCIKINKVIKFRLRHDAEENKTVDLLFDDIASYRVTNESYSNNSIKHEESEDEIKSKLPWSFYTMNNSSFIELIEKETGIPATIYDFKHYYIVSMDDTIDIISNVEPVVELIIDGKVVESTDPEHHSLKF